MRLARKPTWQVVLLLCSMILLGHVNAVKFEQSKTLHEFDGSSEQKQSTQGGNTQSNAQTVEMIQKFMTQEEIQKKIQEELNPDLFEKLQETKRAEEQINKKMDQLHAFEQLQHLEIQKSLSGSPVEEQPKADLLSNSKGKDSVSKVFAKLQKEQKEREKKAAIGVKMDKQMNNESELKLEREARESRQRMREQLEESILASRIKLQEQAEERKKQEEELEKKRKQEEMEREEAERQRQEEERLQQEEESKKKEEEERLLLEEEMRIAEEAKKAKEEAERLAQEEAQRVENERKRVEEEAAKKLEDERRAAEEARVNALRELENERLAEEAAKKQAEEAAAKKEAEERQAQEEIIRKAQEEQRRQEEEVINQEQEEKFKFQQNDITSADQKIEDLMNLDAAKRKEQEDNVDDEDNEELSESQEQSLKKQIKEDKIRIQGQNAPDGVSDETQEKVEENEPIKEKEDEAIAETKIDSKEEQDNQEQQDVQESETDDEVESEKKDEEVENDKTSEEEKTDSDKSTSDSESSTSENQEKKEENDEEEEEKESEEEESEEKEEQSEEKEEQSEEKEENEEEESEEKEEEEESEEKEEEEESEEKEEEESEEKEEEESEEKEEEDKSDTDALFTTTDIKHSSDNTEQQLEDQEAQRRQELRERHEQRKQEKAQKLMDSTPVQTQSNLKVAQDAQENSQPPQDSNLITSVDEFGEQFTFKKAEKQIPLVLPSDNIFGGQQSQFSQNAQQLFKAALVKTSGNKFSKSEIDEINKRAAKYEFLTKKLASSDEDKTDKDNTKVETDSKDAKKDKSDEKDTKKDKSDEKDDSKDADSSTEGSKKSSQKKSENWPSPSKQSGTTDTTVAILCSDSIVQTNRSIQHVCESCKVGEVYELTANNWFQIGLANNHRKEFLDLLNQISDVFPSAKLIAGFSSDGGICFASEKISEPVNLNAALRNFTSSSLSQYTLSSGPLFPIAEELDVDDFSFTVSFQEVKDKLVPEFSNFQMVTRGKWLRKIDEETTLTILHMVFLQQKRATFYFGQISVNDYSTQIHFSHDADNIHESFINIIANLPEESLTLQHQAFKMISQENVESLIPLIQITRGLESIENLKLSSLIFSIAVEKQANSYQIIMNLEDITDFSIGLNLDLNQCIGWVSLFKETASNKFLLDSTNLICNVSQLPAYSHLHIQKSNTLCNYFLRFADDEYKYEEISENVLSKLATFQSTGKLNINLAGLVHIEQLRLHDVSVELFFEPQIIFDVRAQVGSKQLTGPGQFRAKIARLYSQMQLFASFAFGAENPKSLFENIPASDFDATTPKSIYLFFSEQDVNLKELSFLSADLFGPETTEQTWQEGLYLQYVFDIEDTCPVGKLLHNLNAEVNLLHVKGQFKDNVAILSGPIHSELALSDPIKLQGTQLNIVIGSKFDSSELSSKAEKLSNIKLGQFYLDGEFQVKLHTEKLVNFQGALSFDAKTHEGVLLGNSLDSWENAFNKTELKLSEILLKGRIPKDKSKISDFSLNTLSIFGQDCFIEMLGDQNPVFDESKCFYGNAQLHLDFQDFSKDLLATHINSITSQNLLAVFLGYDAISFAKSVSKPIAGMTFPNGLSLKYSQSVVNDSLTSKITTPKGFTLAGESTIFGIRGQTVLNINNEKFLIGLFRFEGVHFAGGNVAVIETEGGSQNNIVLRLQKDNPQLTDLSQVYFKPTALIFNLKVQIDIAVSQETGYRIDVVDKFFESQDNLALRLSAPYVNDISSAQFVLTTVFSAQHVSRLNTLLQEKVSTWVKKTSELFSDIAARVSQTQADLIELNSMICDDLSCPKKPQCSQKPHVQCSKYHQKQVCLEEEMLCLQEAITCEKQEKQCTEKAVKCKAYRQDDPSVCDEFEESCVAFVNKCVKYSQECISQVKTCHKWSLVDDEEKCEEHEMVCDVDLGRDSNCQQQCKRREEEFEVKKDIYEKLAKALINFQTRNRKFTQMAELKEEIASIVEIKFEAQLQKLLSKDDIAPEFSVFTVGGDNGITKERTSFRLERYNFRNEQESVDRLFTKLQQLWANNESIDLLLLEDEAPLILHGILNKIQAAEKLDDDENHFVKLLELGAQWKKRASSA